MNRMYELCTNFLGFHHVAPPRGIRDGAARSTTVKTLALYSMVPVITKGWDGSEMGAVPKLERILPKQYSMCKSHPESLCAPLSAKLLAETLPHLRDACELPAQTTCTQRFLRLARSLDRGSRIRESVSKSHEE
jgi:hypothetical protein